ncbi:MAG: hypothetical protein U9R74_10580 [Pseudomonadota bacterium]|nr:hypothetical protein [Pseudomonadota bacterium]
MQPINRRNRRTGGLFEQRFRLWFIDQNLIEHVLHLPENLLYNAIQHRAGCSYSMMYRFSKLHHTG